MLDPKSADQIVRVTEQIVSEQRLARRQLRAEDLLRRFDELRRDERLDVSAAALLRDVYVQRARLRPN